MNPGHQREACAYANCCTDLTSQDVERPLRMNGLSAYVCVYAQQNAAYSHENDGLPMNRLHAYVCVYAQ